MAARHYSNWLKAFSEYASIGEAPLKFYFWTGVSTIAGALRRRVWFDMGHFRWTPNFYIILVAPPGIVSKTTTIDIGRRLLVKVPGVNLGPDALTWQSLVQSLAKATELVILGDGSKFEMSAITLYSGELGTLLDPKDRQMVDALVSLWDARDSFDKTTKMSGSDHLAFPWLNMIACTTPAWISEHMPQYMASGGLMSRCIFLYSDTKEKFVAYPSPPPHWHDTARMLTEDLAVISGLAGSFRMAPEARQWGEAWYREHWGKPSNGDGHYLGYRARKQTHMHKLAMVIAAAQRSELVVELEDIVFAEQMLLRLEEDSARVFAHVGITQESRGQNEILEVLREVKGGWKKEIFGRLIKRLSWEQYEHGIEACVKAGEVLQVIQGSDVYLSLRVKP